MGNYQNNPKNLLKTVANDSPYESLVTARLAGESRGSLSAEKELQDLGPTSQSTTRQVDDDSSCTLVTQSPEAGPEGLDHDSS